MAMQMRFYVGIFNACDKDTLNDDNVFRGCEFHSWFSLCHTVFCDFKDLVGVFEYDGDFLPVTWLSGINGTPGSVTISDLKEMIRAGKNVVARHTTMKAAIHFLLNYTNCKAP